jgi:hypothetical protein
MIKFRHLFLLCFLLVASVTLSSCFKNGDDSSPSNKALLTSGAWKGSKAIYEGNTYPITELTVTFNSNGTYTTKWEIEGESETDSGTWELIKNEGYLLLDDIDELKIKHLDAKNLHIYDEESEEEMQFVR